MMSIKFDLRRYRKPLADDILFVKRFRHLYYVNYDYYTAIIVHRMKFSMCVIKYKVAVGR